MKNHLNTQELVILSEELSDFAKYAYALDKAVLKCTIKDIKRLEDENYNRMKPYILGTTFEEQDSFFIIHGWSLIAVGRKTILY